MVRDDTRAASEPGGSRGFMYPGPGPGNDIRTARTREPLSQGVRTGALAGFRHDRPCADSSAAASLGLKKPSRTSYSSQHCRCVVSGVAYGAEAALEGLFEAVAGLVRDQPL